MKKGLIKVMALLFGGLFLVTGRAHAACGDPIMNMMCASIGDECTEDYGYATCSSWASPNGDKWFGGSGSSGATAYAPSNDMACPFGKIWANGGCQNYEASGGTSIPDTHNPYYQAPLTRDAPLGPFDPCPNYTCSVMCYVTGDDGIQYEVPAVVGRGDKPETVCMKAMYCYTHYTDYMDSCMAGI